MIKLEQEMTYRVRVNNRFGDQYLRQILHFETGSPRYLWLMRELFVAEGRLAAKDLLEYNVPFGLTIEIAATH